MTKVTKVFIVEDDPYAQDMMVYILTRDWRTCVEGESTLDKKEINRGLEASENNIDLFILDTEVPDEMRLPLEIADYILQRQPNTRILFTGTRPRAEYLRKALSHDRISGYVMKSEICYGLAWATRQAANGSWLVTPKVKKMALDNRVDLPRGCIQVPDQRLQVSSKDDECQTYSELKGNKGNIFRLVVLFSQTHKEVADELNLSQAYISECVSEIYKKFDLNSVIENPELFFEDKVILQHIENIRSRMAQKMRVNTWQGRKSSEMTTLAFHYFTVPSYKILD